MLGALARSREDPLAFVEFYERNAPKVLRYFGLNARDGQAALDLTAECFAKAFEKRKDFRGTTDADAAAWLWSIARNEMARYWRDRAVELSALSRLGMERPVAGEEQIELIERLSRDADARRHLSTSLADLPADQREAITLRVLKGLEYAEIARNLSVSREVVRARVSRGLRTLAAHPPLKRLLEELW